LHLDGWVDCCDALFASTSRERRLEILKDVRTGAFGVAGAVVLIVGQVIAVRAAGSGGAAAVLLAFACSASVMVSSMAVFRYAGQPDSLGAGFAAGAGVPAAVVAGMVVVGAGWLLLGGPGLVAAAIGSAAGLVFSAFASRRLGGVTGDVYGAGGQLAALVTMLVVPPLAGGAS
jgi:adenosylcobinamide-GDP ribazoletransferase